MLVLDTDHLSIVQRGAAEGGVLQQRLERSGLDVATTVATAEEQLRGWLAQINKQHDPLRQIEPYERLAKRLEDFANLTILRFDEAAALQFVALRAQAIRLGTMDLKIASIVLVNNGLLLSRNLRDFKKVRSLKVEDWL